MRSMVSIHSASGQLDRQRVEVHAVDAALDDVALQPSAQALVELGMVDRHRQQLVAGMLGRKPVGELGHGPHRPWAQAAVVVQALEQRVGQEAQSRDQERARAHGRIADLELEDLLRRAGAHSRTLVSPLSGSVSARTAS